MHTASDSPSQIESTRLLRLARQTAVIAAVVALFVAILLGLASAVDVLLMTFAGLLFGIFLSTLADWFYQHTRLGATTSLVAVVVLLLLMVAAVGWFLAPTIIAQLEDLKKKWPEWIDSLRSQISATPWGSWVVEQLPQADQALPRPQALLSRATGVASTAIGGLGVPIMVFAVGLMLAAQPQTYQKGVLCLVPPAGRTRAQEVLREIGSTLKWWLIAKFTAMFIVGVLTWLGLLLLGVEIAATLAVLAALLTFIPNFGPIISAVPAVLLALLQGVDVALWVVVLYVVVQLLESFVVTPLIQYRALSLPPVLVIVAQLAASAWVGVWGLALATPLLAVIVVLVRLLYLEDILHEGEESSSA